MIMLRRDFLIGGVGTSIVAIAGMSRFAHAQNRPFTFCSWGGALSDAEKNAFTAPFASAKSIEIVNTSPMEPAKIKAMVEAKNVEWDLCTVGGRTVWQGAAERFLEPLDYAAIPNAAKLEQGWRAPYGIATSTGATIIAWSTKAFPSDAGPQSWADFWDVKRFPGARGLYKFFLYNYEAATLAAGLRRDEIFPATSEKIDAAFGKLTELKKSVTVWWGAGAQPPQLLSTGELALSSAWSGRIFAAQAEQAPVAYTYKDGIAWANWWVIPKGSPFVSVAHELMDFAVSEKPQEALLPLQAYGPVLGSAAAKADATQRKFLVMSSDNIKNMVILDEQESFKYMKATEERWNKFLLS
jgi:putative spermidine/putrescine transport system substrate-binding protein